MRLLILEPRPCFSGGSERVTLSLAEYLRGKGHSLRLVHCEEGDMLPSYGELCEDVVAKRIQSLAIRQPLRALRDALALRRLAREFQADAIFTAQLSHLSLLGLARRLGAPPLFAHLGWHFSQRSPLYRRLMRDFSRGFTPSEPTATFWRGEGWPAERLRVVPNGVNTRQFVPLDGRARSSFREDQGWSETDQVIVFVGRLSASKGVFTLLKAFASLHDVVPLARLVFVGGGEAAEVAALRSAMEAQLSCASRIQIMGTVCAPEHYLGAAELAVVPSEASEAFGLTAIEAMSCGLTTLVSDAGILPEIVGGGRSDLVFRQGAVDELSTLLRRWLAVPLERAQRGRELRARALEVYEASLCGAAYEREMLRCLA